MNDSLKSPPENVDDGFDLNLASSELTTMALVDATSIAGESTAIEKDQDDLPTKLEPEDIEDKGSISTARSYIAGSTTTQATIAPEVVRERVKKESARRLQHERRKNAKPKGDAGAALRERRTNRDIVKEYAGWEEF